MIYIYIRKRLYAGTVPANKEYATGTVPANKKYAGGTLPVNTYTAPSLNYLPYHLPHTTPIPPPYHPHTNGMWNQAE